MTGINLGDHNYHAKQKDPLKSIREEMRAYHKSTYKDVAKKNTENFKNLANEEQDIYYQMREILPDLRANYSKYCNNISVDKGAIDRHPVLSRAQKYYESKMMQNCIDKHGTGFFKNNASSYGGYGGTAHFMIRALSYIYPMLIIQPLPKLTWREDQAVLDQEGWAQFGVFLTANRVYNATEENEEANSSGRVQATFGEAVYQIVTLRQDIVWDSTPEFYADSSMNNGLVSWVYFEALKRGFDEQINNIYLYGDTNYGMYGLLSNPNITRVNSAGSWAQVTAGGERFSTLDLISLTQQVEQQSLGVYSAKKVMMGLALKPYVVLPRSAYVSTSPIGYVAGQAWGVDFEKTLESARYNPYLNNKGSNTGAHPGNQIAVAYDVDTSYAHISVPFFMFGEPISWEGHKYKLPFLTRTGGYRLIQSPSVAILDNISTLP